MIPNFYYRLIGDKTTREIAGNLDRAESAVIIGPRGCGKRYLLECINRLRVREGKNEILIIGFGEFDIVCQEVVVSKALAEITRCSAVNSIEEWADWVRQHHSMEDPLTIFITNLDGLSKALAHRLLSAIQSLVKAQALITVVTGEGNLIDLIDGSPTSAWSCSHQYVVHAHDQKHFYRFIIKRMFQSNLRFPKDPRKAKETFLELYRQTGGDVSLARAVFWSIGDALNHHFNEASREPTELTMAHLPPRLTPTHIAPVAGLVPFRYGCHCILAAAKEESPIRRDKILQGENRSPVPALRDLEHLLQKTESLRLETGLEPHLLELAGFAKRHDNILEWFSPYTESFVLSYYSPRTLGDHYAFAHDWENAYRLYEQVPLEEKCRPLSDNDHGSLMRLVDGLAIRFHRIVSESSRPGADNGTADFLTPLRLELRLALKNLTGFNNERISFWCLDWRGTWVRTDAEMFPLPLEVRNAWAALAARAGKLPDEVLHESFAGYHWTICRDHEGRPSSAILIDGRDDPLCIHPMRTSVIHRILRGFRRAKERGRLVKQNLREQAEHEILRVFWQLTKDAAWDTMSVLHAIGPTIIQALGSVSRIVFLASGHPKPENTDFVPFYDSKLTTLPGGKTTPVDVPNEFMDLIATGGGIALPPLKLNHILVGTGLAPFEREVACLMIPGVKGMMLVESALAQAFSMTDLNFIKTVSDRIKGSWDQAMRLKLLHDSLNASHTPSLLLDRKRCILFANRRACELLLLPLPGSGWQGAPPPFDTIDVSSAVQAALTPASSQETREFNGVTLPMSGTWLRECHPLVSGDDAPRGWVITFRDRAFLYNSFDLIQKLEAVSDFDDALELILHSLIKSLRVEDAKLRFYLIDPEDPNRLVSKVSVGLTKANAERFKQGEVCYINTPSETAWVCITERSPGALRFNLNESKKGHSGQTSRGLRFKEVTWKQHFDILERELGDLSIDLPLLSEASCLGKLTINFRAADVDSLPAELPMQLGALCVVLGGLLDRVNRDAIRRTQLQRDTEKAMATTAHNLLSQISPFAAFEARYRLCEARFPELKPITDDLSMFHDLACKSVRRIKDRVGEVKLQLDSVDLATVIENALRTVIYETGTWKWDGDRPTIVGLWDGSHISNAFIELAHNSRDFVKSGSSLIIVLSCLMTELEGGACLELCYTDNGCGVPIEFKENIFSGHSFRAGATAPGRGLGLAYVWKVIHAHGGSIRECGEYGTGAVFQIRLPIKSSSDDQRTL